MTLTNREVQKLLDANPTWKRNYVYIAGPYSGRDAHGQQGYMVIEQNILNARNAMKELVERGYGVFCPHTHSAHFEVITHEVDINYWYELDIYFMRFCHAILRLPGYSSGADKEVALCEEWGVPVFYSVKELTENFPLAHIPGSKMDIITQLRTGRL